MKEMQVDFYLKFVLKVVHNFEYVDVLQLYRCKKIRINWFKNNYFCIHIRHEYIPMVQTDGGRNI